MSVGNETRVGFGFDVHRLEDGRPLVLGGITIPYHKGPVGHSDADVLIHAICDALLGALALGDIGQHFPNTDPKWKNANSKLLLKAAMRLISEQGYHIINVDSTICLEAPKIAPHIRDMKTALSPILGIDENRLSIKATTMEGLGFIGREEGVAAHAVALLVETK
jgi:2-C-methyl-D-erythritol 2,4-cyclodiphosphate synthase